MDAVRIGKAIQFLRKKAGYTQLELAERLVVSDKAVSRWERGIGVPDVSLLRRISIILDTDIDSLLEGTVAVHDDSWKGLLYADFPVDTIIHDKPLIDYLLSYFLLSKVRDIIVFAKKAQLDFMLSRYGTGESLGINLTFFEADSEASITIEKHKDIFASRSVMAVYGPCVLYGVDLTRFLQRGMLGDEGVKTLLTVKDDERAEVFMNDAKAVMRSAENSISTRYHYCMLPFLFSRDGIGKLLGQYHSVEGLVQQLIDRERLFAEALDKGYVDFNITSDEEAHVASTFIGIVQRQTKTSVCCPREIAARRALIAGE